MSITFFDCDMWVIVIVINLNKPTTSNLCRICFLIFLLYNIHAIFIYTNSFSKEIQAYIITIEHHLYRFCFWCPCHTNQFAQFKSCSIAQKSFLISSIIRMSKQCEVLTLIHAEKWLFVSKFDTIWFLIKTGPCIVATSFDFHCKRRSSCTYVLVSSQPQSIHIVSGIDIVIFADNRSIIFRLNMHYWQGTRIGYCLQGKKHIGENKKDNRSFHFSL